MNYQKFADGTYDAMAGEYNYSCYPYYCPENKTEKAFKIAQVLIEKKIVKVDVKGFIELVNEVSKVI